jgi:hypothetical protein
MGRGRHAGTGRSRRSPLVVLIEKVRHHVIGLRALSLVRYRLTCVPNHSFPGLQRSCLRKYLSREGFHTSSRCGLAPRQPRETWAATVSREIRCDRSIQDLTLVDPSAAKISLVLRPEHVELTGHDLAPEPALSPDLIFINRSVACR